MEQKSNTEARTTIDTMLELIRSKGRIDLNSIASSLGIAPSVVEGWAKVLESGNLIKISYEVGKMFLTPMELSKDELQALESKTQQQKFIMSEEIDADLISTEKLEQSLREIESNISGFEQRLQKESPEARKKIEELSKMYAQMRSYQSNIDAIKKGISSDYDNMEKRFNDLLAKLGKVSEQEQKAKGGIPGTIQENINNARAALQELETVKKNVAQSIENTRKDLENQLKQESARLDSIIKQSHSELENAYKELEKEAGSYKGDIKEIKELQLMEEQLSKKLNQQHSEFNSNYSKLEQSLKQATANFSPKYEEAMNELNKVMEGSGSMGEIIKNMSDLKMEIEDLGPKLNNYRAELQKLKDQVDALNAAKNLSVKEKEQKMSDLKAKGDAIKDEIKTKKSKISDSLNNINKLTQKMKPDKKSDDNAQSEKA
jgi:chromosome segregation ATPase